MEGNLDMSFVGNLEGNKIVFDAESFSFDRLKSSFLRAISDFVFCSTTLDCSFARILLYNLSFV